MLWCLWLIFFWLLLKLISTQDKTKLVEESMILKRVKKDEFEKYYPKQNYDNTAYLCSAIYAFLEWLLDCWDVFFLSKNKMLKCLIIWYINITMIFKRLK